MVDAGIVFNKLKCKVVLHNIRITSPIIATYVNNSYNHQAILFIPGCNEIISGERTMQGDSAVVTLYALDSLLLLDVVSSKNTKHAAYADNLSCSSKLQERTIWSHKISKLDPKEWLFFKETKLKINKEGQKHLVAVIGSIKCKSEYVISKVKE